MPRLLLYQEAPWYLGPRSRRTATWRTPRELSWTGWGLQPSGQWYVEPYGSSDLGGDPSDDERPSLSSASPSADDDPEDPDYPKAKKKKKKRKSRRLHSKDANTVAISKIVFNLPDFTGKDLCGFAENFGRFPRMTGQTHASGRVKCDLLLQCCKTKYPEKQVKQIVTKSAAALLSTTDYASIAQ